MMKKIFFLLLLVMFFACSNDDSYQIIENPVSVDLENVPYQKLSEYHFFVGDLKNLNPNQELLQYKPNSELFTDYAKKLRYIWIPESQKATFVSENTPLNLPVGSVLIKIFYYDQLQLGSERKIIETRLMIRKSEGWIFANYKWNQEQTEAYYDMNGSTIPLTINHNNQTIGFDYAIPSSSQCNMCHSQNDIPQPIGIKPIHLNYVLSGENQLQKWIQKGFLENNIPSLINSVVDYSDTSKSLSQRTRAYFDIQCAHCHNDLGTAYYVPLRMSYDLTENSQNMGVCVPPLMEIPSIDRGHVITPQQPENSTLLYMINTNESQYKMPRIGRSVVHQEGVDLIEEWVNSLELCE